MAEPVFGLTFEKVSDIVRPVVEDHGWGDITRCAEQPFYGMYKIRIRPGASQPLHLRMLGGGVYFVENGDVVVRTVNVDGVRSASRVLSGGVLDAPAGMVHALCSRGGASVFLFTDRPASDLVLVETQPQADTDLEAALNAPGEKVGATTFDAREKYWGRIESIVSGDFAGKRIELRNGGQSSLEFHVNKTESYYIQAGRVKVGLRIGRGENKSVVLEQGDRFDIPPGLMHMRIGLEDSIIMEVSTPDSDGDSYLVEDGKTYEHIEQ